MIVLNTIISDESRGKLGDERCLDKLLSKVDTAVKDFFHLCPEGKDCKLHLAISIEQPKILPEELS